MRCQARVRPEALELRSRFKDCEGLRCCRYATARVRKNWFCYQHARIYREHYRVLDRILAIPARVI